MGIGSKQTRARAVKAIATVLLALAAVPAARSEDLSGYSGQGLFKAYCVSCHGPNGTGDGPVAASLKVQVPDLTRIAARHGGSFPAEQVRKIIDGRTMIPPHGTREMPVWGMGFRLAGKGDPQNEQRANSLVALLVEYLRAQQQH
jgi:mono/diheme cytochrome c family protein